MKKTNLTLILSILCLLVFPGIANAGLSEDCSAFTCDEGEDYYAGECRTHIETLSDCTNGTLETWTSYPGSGYNKSFSCSAGCTRSVIENPDWIRGSDQITYTAGAVGIGTSSPSYELDVTGRAKASTYMMAPYFMDTDGEGYYYVDPNSTSYFNDVRTYGDIYVMGNVGIGDSSPGTTLNVVGHIRASNESGETNYLEIDHGGSNAYMNWAGAGDLDFRYGGSTKMTLTSTGNLEIGSFYFDGDDDSWLRLRNADGGANTSSLQNFAVNSFWVNGDQYTAGNLGIGDTTPSYKLDVNGSIRATNSIYGDYLRSYGNLRVDGASNFYGTVYHTENGGTSSSIYYFDNTSTSTNADVMSLEIGRSNTSTSNCFIKFQNADYDGTSSNLGTICGDGSNGLTFDTQGDFHFTDSIYAPIMYDSNDTSYYINPSATSKLTTLYVNGSKITSDSRIKLDQKNIEYGLNEILELQPKSYNKYSYAFDDGGLVLGDDYENEIGLVAQDVYTLMPEIASKPDNENRGVWALDYNQLIPVLIKGIQEQQEIIDNLEARIEVLETSNK